VCKAGPVSHPKRAALDAQVTAVWTRGGSKQRVSVLGLLLPVRAPEGAEWIDCYRRWVRGA
jgi:hypothetical protein